MKVVQIKSGSWARARTERALEVASCGRLLADSPLGERSLADNPSLAGRFRNPLWPPEPPLPLVGRTVEGSAARQQAEGATTAKRSSGCSRPNGAQSSHVVARQQDTKTSSLALEWRQHMTSVRPSGTLGLAHAMSEPSLPSRRLTPANLKPRWREGLPRHGSKPPTPIPRSQSGLISAALLLETEPSPAPADAADAPFHGVQPFLDPLLQHIA